MKIYTCSFGNKIRNKKKVTLYSETICFKHNLEPFFVVICGKHAKLLYQMYSGFYPHIIDLYI